MLTKTAVSRAVNSLALLKFFPSGNADAVRAIISTLRELFDSEETLELAMSSLLSEVDEWTGPAAFRKALIEKRPKPVTIGRGCQTCGDSGWIGFAALCEWIGRRWRIVKRMSYEAAKEWLKNNREARRNWERDIYEMSSPCDRCELGRRISGHLATLT